jgi:KDO2-lipid IV(A) lauroyltransferase
MARTVVPTFNHRIQYVLFRVVEWLARMLPRRLAWSMGRAAGRLFCLADARHRRVVRDNLRKADLGLDEAGVLALSRACFEHFGALLFTTLRLLSASPDELRRIIRLEGKEHLEAAFAEGKGVIGLTGHLGNWELTALALSMEGRTLAVIGRELDNPLLETPLREFRTRFGNSVIAKDGAARGALKALKAKQMVGFLLDQDALAAGVFVKYMGRWASTFSTAGMLAVRFDLPILPICSQVHEDGTVTVRVHPPFHPTLTGDPVRDTWVATQRMTAWIEAQVRQTPAQWLWMHRRFKTQPGPGEPPLPPDEWMASYQ